MQQLDTFISILSVIPIWLWVIAPALILLGITYLITRHRNTALLVGGLAFLATLLTYCFHLYERYLMNHFVGGYDDMGLPTDFSRSGWLLLYDAWPIWIMPLVTIIGLAIAGYYIYDYIQRGQHKKILQPDIDDTDDFHASRSPDMVLDKLEIQKLKHKLAVAEEKFRIIKSEQKGSGAARSSNRHIQELQATRAELVENRKKIQAAEERNKILEEDLERANSLIDRLLNEKFGDEKDA